MQLVPKMFVDSALCGFSKEFFAIVFASGDQMTGAAITPRHFKAVFNMLKSNIDRYEKIYGEIKIEIG